MTIDSTGGSNRAALEAARRAAEEEARRARQAEARRQAEAQAREDAAREAGERNRFDAAADATGETEGNRLVELGARSAVVPADAQGADGQALMRRHTGPLGEQDMAGPGGATTVTAERAARRLERLQAQVGEANSPEEVMEIAGRAMELAGRVADPEGPEGAAAVREALQLGARLLAAGTAAIAVGATRTALAGDPEAAAARTASLLADPQGYADQVGSLDALQGSPLGERLAEDQAAIALEATPENLAAFLGTTSLGKLPEDMVANLDALRETADPALRSAIEAVNAPVQALGTKAVTGGFSPVDELRGVAATAFDGSLTVVAAGLDAVGQDHLSDNVETIRDVGESLIRDGDLEGAANAILDRALGPQIPEFEGQIDGVTGAITNRLDRGDSVFASIDAEAQISLGAQFEGRVGGTVQLGRNQGGNIELSMEIRGGVGVGYGAELGFRNPGAEATIGANTGVDADASGRLTLEFDPTNEADVARLQALIEPPDLDGLVDANFNPLEIIGDRAQALNDAIAQNRASHTIAGELSASTEVGGQASAGGVAEVGASLHARAGIGVSNRYHADGRTERTFSLSSEAGAELTATVGPLEAGATAEATAIASVTEERDAQGRLIGVSGLVGADTSAGLDVGTGGGILALEHDEAESTEVTLVGEALEEAQRRIDDRDEDPLLVFAELSRDPANVETEVTTTTTDALTLSISGGVAVAIGLEGEVDVSIGRTHEEVRPG